MHKNPKTQHHQISFVRQTFVFEAYLHEDANLKSRIQSLHESTMDETCRKNQTKSQNEPSRNHQPLKPLSSPLSPLHRPPRTMSHLQTTTTSMSCDPNPLLRQDRVEIGPSRNSKFEV